jgi:N-acetylglutamate synthase-like GNAT family acetyltransferase
MNILDYFSLADVAVSEVDVLRYPVVNHFYKTQNTKVSCGKRENVYIVEHPNFGIVAATRLVKFESCAYWLRNMMVHRDLRGAGLGRVIMEYMHKNIAPADCYCFSLIEVTEFYRKLGFVQATPKNSVNDIYEHFIRYKTRGRDWVLMKLPGHHIDS